MKQYCALTLTLARSMLREPAGLFFTVIFAPMLVLVLGLIFSNDPSPAFGGKGFVEATLPATACLVAAITGTMVLPVSQLQLRESGALRRLRLTPLRPSVYVSADLTVNFLISMCGILLALLLGAVVFDVVPQGNIFSVIAGADLGLMSFLALGYTLAAIYPSAAAATGIGNGIMIILVISSGVFFPLAALPQGIQSAISFSPLRQLVLLVQGLWEGNSWSEHSVQLAVLIGMIVVFGACGAKLFKWDSK